MRITSVKRNLELKNSATGEVIFSKVIDAVSYDEISVFAAAYYSPNIDSTTMAVLSRTEGATYHLEQPASGEASLHIFHGAGDTPTEGTPNLDLTVSYLVDTTMVDSLLTPNTYDVAGIKLTSEFISFGELDKNANFTLKPGEYTFNFNWVDADGNETDSLITSVAATLQEGTINYIYISGEPSNIKTNFQEIMPLPELSK